jgi:hypothetical protein
MALGMALAGTGLLLLERIGAHTGYGALWWDFLLIGIGMGLTMTPMTAAVMGSVPPERSGIASATTATSREVGGVFGIALLGAVVTARMKTRLAIRLSNAGIPVDIRHRVLASVNHGSPHAIPGVPTQVLRPIIDAVSASFVDGMHAALLIAGLAVLSGSLLSLLFVGTPARPRQETTAGALQPQP